MPPYLAHALLGGTPIALLCGVVGYFLVLRAQVFAGDALSHVAYTGAVAALAAGVDLRLGLFGATVAVGAGLGLLRGGGGGVDDVTIGTTFSWILGLATLFVAIAPSGGNGTATVSVLFGSLFGIGSAAAGVDAAVCLLAVAVLAVGARPLLFASLDPQVAATRGVPVRLLGVGFLALVGLAAAEASQAIGALLLLGLLAAPPAAALRLTARPAAGLALAGAFAVGALWAGVAIAVLVPAAPVSFTVMAVAATQYAVAASAAALRSRAGLRTR